MLNEIDLSRADLNLLVMFEAVLAEAHVGRAAARLSLSPSAVSHGLKRLRRLLGEPLVVSTPKGVDTTPPAAPVRSYDPPRVRSPPPAQPSLPRRSPTSWRVRGPCSPRPRRSIRTARA